MSTTKVEEGAQPDAAVAPTTKDETVKTEAVNDVKDGDVKSDSKDFEKNGGETKENKGVRTYENGMLKTSAREQTDRRKNSKYDPSVLPTTDNPKEIRGQVEFYFSDTNLPDDKHLWDLTDGSTNLPVKIDELLKFGRMKRFQPRSAVIAALKESKFLEVTGPDGLEEVKRRVAYDPTIPRPKAEARSIYVKGFGDEEPSSQFDIEAFFAPYGPTNAVRLRRTDDKLFKGSVFVEFQDEETAEKFLALDPKPLWKGKHQLKVTSKKEYQDEKMQEIHDGKVQPKESWGPARGRGRGRGRGDNRGFRGDRDRGDRDRGARDRSDRDPNDWKKRREDDRANGFKDDRNRRDNKSGRGRGRRDDRGPRNNDRNHEREGKNGGDAPVKAEDDKTNANVDDGEKGAATKNIDVKSEATTESPSVENNKKRVRENDDGGEEAPAKKVDSKSEVAAESS